MFLLFFVITRASPRNVSEDVIIEEQVTKTDINDNMMMENADYTDGLMEEEYSTDFETNVLSELLHSKENAHKMDTTRTRQSNQRNFNSPTQFEREQFNETDVYNYSDQESPEFSSRREEAPLGASASYLASYSPDVPPIGERETPIGKGMSTESIHSYKEKWQNLAHSAKNNGLNTDSHEKHHSLEEIYQEEPVEHQEGQYQQKHKHKLKEEQRQRQSVNQQHKPDHKPNRRQFSQSAQLVRQQIEVANKLRALSAQGSYAFENTRDLDIPREANPTNSQENRQV